MVSYVVGLPSRWHFIGRASAYTSKSRIKSLMIFDAGVKVDQATSPRYGVYHNFVLHGPSGDEDSKAKMQRLCLPTAAYTGES